MNTGGTPSGYLRDSGGKYRDSNTRGVKERGISRNRGERGDVSSWYL